MTLWKIYKFFVSKKKKSVVRHFWNDLHDVEIIADFPSTAPGFFKDLKQLKSLSDKSIHGFVGDIEKHLQTVLFIPRRG